MFCGFGKAIGCGRIKTNAFKLIIIICLQLLNLSHQYVINIIVFKIFLCTLIIM